MACAVFDVAVAQRIREALFNSEFLLFGEGKEICFVPMLCVHDAFVVWDPCCVATLLDNKTKKKISEFHFLFCFDLVLNFYLSTFGLADIPRMINCVNSDGCLVAPARTRP